MTNPNPECPREDCRFSYGGGTTTCVYYPPVYDKNGVNINPDRFGGNYNIEDWGGNTPIVPDETMEELLKNGVRND